jgi:hypothetical protein
MLRNFKLQGLSPEDAAFRTREAIAKRFGLGR